MNERQHLMELLDFRDRDPNSAGVPYIAPSDHVVEIGGGAGQLFEGLGWPGHTRIVIEPDPEAIAMGEERCTTNVTFLHGTGENMPLPDDAVSLLVSRHTMHMNIPKFIFEARRVINDGGRLWITLHSKATAKAWLRTEHEFAKRAPMSLSARIGMELRHALFHRYVVLNGHLLYLGANLMPFFDGKYRSWQDIDVMTWLLGEAGFVVVGCSDTTMEAVLDKGKELS